VVEVRRNGPERRSVSSRFLEVALLKPASSQSRYIFEEEPDEQTSSLFKRTSYNRDDQAITDRSMDKAQSLILNG